MKAPRAMLAMFTSMLNVVFSGMVSRFLGLVITVDTILFVAGIFPIACLGVSRWPRMGIPDATYECRCKTLPSPEDRWSRSGLSRS